MECDAPNCKKAEEREQEIGGAFETPAKERMCENMCENAMMWENAAFKSTLKVTKSSNTSILLPEAYICPSMAISTEFVCASYCLAYQGCWRHTVAAHQPQAMPRRRKLRRFTYPLGACGLLHQNPSALNGYNVIKAVSLHAIKLVTFGSVFEAQPPRGWLGCRV